MTATLPRRVVTLSATEPGRALAARLPYRHLHGDVAARLRQEWAEVDGLVVILAAGATVRLMAPLLTDKATDPCVVCVDDAGRYAVVLCGGHARGGNALARAVAARLGSEPVITTATDRLGVPALDQIPAMAAEGDVARVTAALLAGRAVALDNELGWPVPDWLAAAGAAAAPTAAPPAVGAEPGGHHGRIVVTDRTAEDGTGQATEAGTPVVHLRPPSLVVGVGSSTDATADDVIEAAATTLDANGLSCAAVERIATIDRRAAHPAVTALAEAWGVPVTGFSAVQLDALDVPSPSAAVRRAVGTASVAEAAAVLGSGRGGRLVVAKEVYPRATVAVARRAQPAGRVSVVGLGPGGAEHRTPAAEQAVRQAEVVIGFSAYIEQCRDLLEPAQQVVAFPLGTEVARAQRALDEASAGRRVALVCSGDAGVYAMASPVLELEASAGADVEVVPGVTAGLAAAALLGAPIGHDHALVSLSDLHTPWPRIAARLEAAAAADLVLVLYNPRSVKRTWQLGEARRIVLAHRLPSTPVGLVTDAGRPGQRVVQTTLEEMPIDQVSMTTCVIIGGRATRRVGGRMVTPRGYFE